MDSSEKAFHIFVGNKLDLAEAFRISHLLNLNLTVKELNIDFTNLEFSKPSGMLFLSSELHDIAAAREFFELAPIELQYNRDDPRITYLCHVGFFKYFAHDFGKMPGEARGGDSYIPIRKIPRAAIETRKTYASEPLGGPISKIADDLAIVLTKSNDFKRFKPVSYCIREVVRNVFEHSEADYCAMVGQSWAGDEVEIAICDRGIGIRRSLERKYDLSGTHSLRHAIQPGVSRSDTDKVTDNPWANSGLDRKSVV